MPFRVGAGELRRQIWGLSFLLLPCELQESIQIVEPDDKRLYPGSHLASSRYIFKAVIIVASKIIEMKFWGVCH